jgi:hypothetical protein
MQRTQKQIKDLSKESIAKLIDAGFKLDSSIDKSKVTASTGNFYFFYLNCYSDWYSPLIWAVRNKDLNLIKDLVQAGANVNTETKPPLIEAAKLGYHTIVKYLLENGADPDIKGNFREIKNSNAYDITNHIRKQSICTIPGFIITMFKCTGSDLDKTCSLLRAAMEKKNNLSANTVDILNLSDAHFQ